MPGTAPICGIYMITNVVNRKRYIGASSDIKHRWASHVSLLRRNRNVCTLLQHSWNKYGETSFKFMILQIVESINDLMMAESAMIEELAPELNILEPMQEYSQKTRDKIGANGLGRKHSFETRAKMSEAQRGRKCTVEQRERMSIAAKRRGNSEEQINRIRALGMTRKGSKQPREAVEKTAAARRGIPRPQLVRDKIRAKLIGHPVSQETIEKVRATKLAKVSRDA